MVYVNYRVFLVSGDVCMGQKLDVIIEGALNTLDLAIFVS